MVFLVFLITRCDGSSLYLPCILLAWSTLLIFLDVFFANISLEMSALSMDNKIPHYSGEPCFKTRKGDMQSSARVEHTAFSCGGIQRGQRPFWHTTLLAKCSVLYALLALLRKYRCCRGGQGR